eukprot:184818_1
MADIVFVINRFKLSYEHVLKHVLLMIIVEVCVGHVNSSFSIITPVSGLNKYVDAADNYKCIIMCARLGFLFSIESMMNDGRSEVVKTVWTNNYFCEMQISIEAGN